MASRSENDAPSRLSSHAGSLRPPAASSRRGSNQPGSKASGNTGAMTPKLENSYKMAPDVRFNRTRVQAVMAQTLKARLETAEYCPNSVKSLTSELCDTIKNQVKTLGYSRHKLISNVVVGPVNGQGVRVASRCVWDEKNDDFASASFQNESLFVAASVYAVYCE